MNTHTAADTAKEARRLQRDGLSPEAAAEYLGISIERLAQIGGLMDSPPTIYLTPEERSDNLPDGWVEGLVRAGEMEAEGWM